jgi:pyruvate/2-oxoacid:ferredoxin oxidoreductase beta subunit
MANNPFLSDAAAKAAADAACALCNGGTIQIRSGAQPANANAAATGTLLVTLTFSATAFAAAVANVATANAIGSANAVASGTAAWFRALKSDGTTVVFDGSVGTSGADLNLSSTAITSGGNVAISSFTYTQTE